MAIFRRILTFALAIIVILIGISYFLPKIARVERSVVVTAEPHKVFPFVNDLTLFREWSPWTGIDPQTQYVFSDPSQGVGATMHWTSNHQQVGNGSMEITEVIEDEAVQVTLDFGEMGTAKSYFFVEAVDSGSEVTWGFETDLSADPVSRYVGLMYDKFFIGPSYEKGLANLKTMIESGNVSASDVD